MTITSCTESRARYAEVLDGVANGREEVLITRAGHEPVVIVSLEDDESLRETAYLMRSPTNARRLLDSMERREANTLRADIQRSGNEGIGKPKALKHDFAGYRSRRIAHDHCLVQERRRGGQNRRLPLPRRISGPRRERATGSGHA